MIELWKKVIWVRMLATSLELHIFLVTNLFSQHFRRLEIICSGPSDKAAKEAHGKLCLHIYGNADSKNKFIY